MNVPLRSWLAQQLQDWKKRRLFEQERLSVSFLNTVAQTMQELDVSKAELADRLGCSRANVTQLLSGNRNVTLHTMSDLAVALGRRVTVDLQPLDEVDFQPIPKASVQVPPYRIRKIVWAELQNGAPAPALSAAPGAELVMAP